MKKHILLIDDDVDELKIFTDVLEELPGNYKCTYASSAFQAFDMLKFIHPHLIFIDYNLPAMNGIELLGEIKKERELMEIPVYIYSTTVSPETKRLASLLGAAGSLQKPSSIGSMRALLMRSLVTANVGVEN